MDDHQVTVSQPLLIPEIAQIICSFVHGGDMHNLALSCRTMYYAMTARLWHTLHPRSHMVLRKLKNTLDGRYSPPLKTLDPQYHRQVRVFRCSLKEDITTHIMFERPFFDHFLFPRLHTLVFSYAAAQDSSVAPMIKASAQHLRYVDLSHCYCLSTDAIRPLLKMRTTTTTTSRLETLILYGCGKIDPAALVTLVQQHHHTLTCVRLTDIPDALLDALQHCHQLQDLGLEHCSDDLSEAALTRFFTTDHRLHRLRFRDIANLTSQHLERMAQASGRHLVHLDMSECPRITSAGLVQLAPLCPQLDTLCLAYQSGVTNTSLRAFATFCPILQHLDVAGSRSLTDAAFETTTAAGNLTMLQTLNLSGLESQLSADLIYHLLLRWPTTLQELCLGVAYDLREAQVILDQVNNTSSSTAALYQMNVEKCHTICRSVTSPPSSSSSLV